MTCFDGPFSGRLLFSSCGYAMTDMFTKDASVWGKGLCISSVYTVTDTSTSLSHSIKENEMFSDQRQVSECAHSYGKT